eukprot:scaffold1581_cov124-Skeletonema_dohrnii-CCMP3373.AAC.1
MNTRSKTREDNNDEEYDGDEPEGVDSTVQAAEDTSTIRRSTREGRGTTSRFDDFVCTTASEDSPEQVTRAAKERAVNPPTSAATKPSTASKVASTTKTTTTVQTTRKKKSDNQRAQVASDGAPNQPQLSATDYCRLIVAGQQADREANQAHREANQAHHEANQAHHEANQAAARNLFARRRKWAQLEMSSGDSSTGGSGASVGSVGVASVGDRGASIGSIDSGASNTQRREELLSDTPTGSVSNSTPKSFTPTATLQSTKGATADSLPPFCCVGDTIDLDSLPKRLFPEEAAIVFPLKNNSSNNGQQHFVIVGTIAIVTACSEAGSNGRKVDITWCCRRSTIRSLTLNVEDTGATLAHANGRMPLIFESSDSCLDFVQAFYRGPSKSVSQVSSPSQQSPASEEVPKESTESELVLKKDESSGLVGDGNIKADPTEEETLEGVQANVSADEGTKNTEKKTKKEGEVTGPRQAILDAIKKKGNGGDNSTKPPVPTDPKQALFAATKGKGAEPSQSKLSDEEDRVASKYRRMLKMGIPLDAVKHEMKKEGVDPKIASAVADEAPPHVTLIEHATPAKPKSKSGSTAGPALSEEEEEIASKYRKMLKVCIPKDAVRHDMKKEGVSEKIIEAIFGKEDTIDTVNNMETPAKGKNTKTK